MSLLPYGLYVSRAGEMKKRLSISIVGQLAVAAIAVVFSTASLTAQQLPPPNTVTTNPDLGFCQLTNFNSWWVNGSPSLNGAVNPANSTQLNTSTFCNFYQWGQQMFLWVASPSSQIYGGSGRVFDSPIFFDVSVPDPKKNNTRVLIPHTPGFVHSLALRVTELGPNDFPIKMSKEGQLLEVHPAPVGPHKKPLVLNQSGAKVEAQQLSVEKGKLVAKDKAGKVIPNFKPSLPLKQVGRVLEVEEFIINGKPVLVDQSDTVIETTEEGQATGDVLMSQKMTQPNGSLVYYVTMVNDVWAYWHQKYPAVTPPNGNDPSPSNVSFPTSQGGIPTLPDCNSQFCALAIELKTSWIDVTNLPNPGNYITMKARVPTYTTNSSNTHWTPTGSTTTKTLALVGMHVIGSANGHPEMIWASFEAFGNTPDGTGPMPYQYYNANNSPALGPPNPPGPWLFASSSAPSTFNVSHMSVSTPQPCVKGSPSGSICAQPQSPPQPPPPFTISPSDTVRTAPFGMPNGSFTNNATNGSTPISTNNVVSNTQVISANNQVLTAMPKGDVRNNYYLLGAVWTIGGVPPSANNCVTAIQPSPSSPTNQVGTCMLENSTMETYAQLAANWQNPPQNAFQSSCFDCHTASATTSGVTSTDTSHIYSATWPLPSLGKIFGGKTGAKSTAAKK